MSESGNKDTEQKTSTHQIAYRQHVLKVGRHGVVLHGHEEGVEDDTDSDGQVHEGIHDYQVYNLLDLNPSWGTFPDQECVRKLIPAWRTLPLRLLQF